MEGLINMKIMILSPASNSYFKVLDWMKDDLDNEYIILVNNIHMEDYKLSSRKNTEIIAVKNWSYCEIDNIFNEIMIKSKIDVLFSYTEEDVLLAAKLREKYKIEGQNISSALAFRDKDIMKKYIFKKGLRVPKFTSISSQQEVYDFIEINGYPFVLKPIDGGGAVGVRIIHDKNELDNYFQENKVENCLCEEYIAYPVFHIDGLVLDGKLIYSFPFRYEENCLNYQNQNGSVISVLLDYNSKEYLKLSDYSKAVINALPSPSNFLFHLEVFYDGEEIIFCEIACRMGGGRILSCIKKEFNFDPIGTLLQYEINHKVDIADLKFKWKKNYGFILCGPLEGELIEIPLEIPDQFNVFDYLVFAKKGNVYEHTTSCVENVAAICSLGDNHKDVFGNLKKIDEWFKESCVYRK